MRAVDPALYNISSDARLCGIDSILYIQRLRRKTDNFDMYVNMSKKPAKN
jgi:hypothetical protein